MLTKDQILRMGVIFLFVIGIVAIFDMAAANPSPTNNTVTNNTVHYNFTVNMHYIEAGTIIIPPKIIGNISNVTIPKDKITKGNNILIKPIVTYINENAETIIINEGKLVYKISTLDGKRVYDTLLKPGRYLFFPKLPVGHYNVRLSYIDNENMRIETVTGCLSIV